MNLDDQQKMKVAEWVAQGLKLSEIQNLLAAQFGVKLTYIEVRMLVDDLKLTPKDPEPPKPIAPSNLISSSSAPTATKPTSDSLTKTAESTPISSGVSVTVDQLTRPGAVISGKVIFSDGKIADWYLDQTGRLGLVPQQQGYRPSAADVQQFQQVLETEVAKLGF